MSLHSHSPVGIPARNARSGSTTDPNSHPALGSPPGTAPALRAPQKQGTAPSGTLLQKLSDPPSAPASNKERKRGKKSCFWLKKVTKKQGEGRAGLTRALHNQPSHSGKHRLLRWGGGIQGSAKPAHTRALPPRVPGVLFVPKMTDFHTWGVKDGSHSLVLLRAPLRDFLQFCPGSSEGSAGRKQQNPPVLGRNTNMGK